MATRRKSDEDKTDETQTAGTQSDESKTEAPAGENLDALTEEQEKADKPDADVPGGTTVTSDEAEERASDADGDGTVFEGGEKVGYVYLTAQELKEGYKARTSDSDDGDSVSWNAQWAAEEREDHDRVALVPVTGTPGQTFTVGELPDVKVMERAGIDPVQFLAGLPVRASASNESPRKGIPA